MHHVLPAAAGVGKALAAEFIKAGDSVVVSSREGASKPGSKHVSLRVFDCFAKKG